MKIRAYSFFTFLIAQTAIAQNNQEVSNIPSLWIKGKVEHSNSARGVDSYSFNFNPILDADGEKKIYKNVLTEKYTLFSVFQSDSDAEINLINLKKNGKTTSITNKKVSEDKEHKFQKVDSKQGMILTYISSSEFKGRKKSSINVENHSGTSAEGNRTDLMELICYPRLLEDIERRKIESYLSIKYGISLLGKVDYFRSDGLKIWDSKENDAYNDRVTGIGRDDLSGLYQKQSGNAQKDGLYIALGAFHKSNSENENEMPDGNFLVWADNSGSLAMASDKKSATAVKKMKRLWKIQATTDEQSSSNFTQIMVDKVAFSIDEQNQKESEPLKDDFLWLAIDRNGSTSFDYLNAEYHRSSRDEEGKLYFENIVWDADSSGSDTFTFVKGPDFFVIDALTETDCIQEKATANLSFIGGQGPFTIRLASNLDAQSYTTEARHFEVPALDGSVVLYDVNDNRQRHQKDTLRLQNVNRIEATLEKQWYLNGKTKQVAIVPKIDNLVEQQLSIVWKQGETVLSTEENLTAREEGDYLLVISNANGCVHELPFHVHNALENTSEHWTIYPNPAQPDEEFTLKFDLQKESDVRVDFFDFSNKLIKQKHLGKLKSYEYKESLPNIGTFLIMVSIDGKATSAKIIIR